MSDDEKVTMTTDDIALVRAIVRWRRENDVRFIRWPKGGFGRFDEWYRFRGYGKAAVAFDEAGVFVTHDIHSDGLRLPAASVSQTVDMLVTFGFLPERFSSAYRSGWEAHAEATDEDGTLDLLTWPELAPAVKP